MHISLPLPLPHPLARLGRILVALERARAGVDPRSHDEYDPLDRHGEPRGGTASESRPDLEFFSLSRREPTPTPARRSDDLEFWSLGRVEGTVSDRHDGLGDLSLERGFPPRPGP
jgi:hypothetical protein